MRGSAPQVEDGDHDGQHPQRTVAYDIDKAVPRVAKYRSRGPFELGHRDAGEESGRRDEGSGGDQQRASRAQQGDRSPTDPWPHHGCHQVGPAVDRVDPIP